MRTTTPAVFKAPSRRSWPSLSFARIHPTESHVAGPVPAPAAMLTEIYIEALLVDEELADQVWEAWDAGDIDDEAACLAWWFIVQRPLSTRKRTLS